ncbi:MAG: 50S ribosomal protein L9 [Burkholderiaceae bacterium]|nr:MAG: 50S ribosomal protein L9 [Burkholderiaceae bacterium]|tara:strand:- start:263 stop:721 length:459 start_codon:yes stop_codon:yes gene_type:complete
MQVILLDRIAKLGKLGEVVRVRDGYARNFLIPKGLAKRATQKAIGDFERQKVELEQKASDKLKKAQELGSRLSGIVVEIVQKAGVDGRLFGSVTNQDIVEKLGNDGIEITKSQVNMPEGPIKSAGEHLIRVSPHSEVVVELSIKVVPEMSDK